MTAGRQPVLQQVSSAMSFVRPAFVSMCAGGGVGMGWECVQHLPGT